MHLLVTGGSGFIGSNFVEYWLKKYPQDRITNIDLMTYAANPRTVIHHSTLFGDRYTHIAGDITNEELIRNQVKLTDCIVHFAAESHVDRSIVSPRIFLETNILGTHTLLEAARIYKKRFHHISTDEVYGTLDLESSEKFSENTPHNPRSPYAASKSASDELVSSYFHTYGVQATITNCSNNYGPYQFPEKVIPLYITRLLQDKPVPIYGEGKAIRDYLHVEDHCSAIDLVLQKGRIGETYCVGGESEKNTITVGNTIADLLDKPRSLLRHTKDRPGHDPRYAIDFSKIQNELGWKPHYSFEEGLMKTISWYKNNTDWWMPIAHEAEAIAEKYLENT